jgi:hypothetical protein
MFGRGRGADVLQRLMKQPEFWAMKCGIITLQLWKRGLTLMRMRRSNSASSTSWLDRRAVSSVRGNCGTRGLVCSVLGAEEISDCLLRSLGGASRWDGDFFLG